MKIHLIKIFFITTTLFNCILNFKPSDNRGEITKKKSNNNANQRKECEIKEKCRECTFEEIKTNSECQESGYKQLLHCNFYDDVILIDEIYFSEQCSENLKTNSVYVLLVISVLLGLLSFYIRKSHKKFILQKTFEKLTIIRKDN